jgi:WD40 repeat protein
MNGRLEIATRPLKRMRMTKYLIEGPLPIKDLCDIISAYNAAFEGRFRRSLLVGLKCMTSLVELPDGKLVSSSDDAVRVWHNDVCVRTLERQISFNWALAVLPDGNLVSGSDDKRIRVWDLANGACVRTLVCHTIVTALAVLPDGKLVSGSADSIVRVWEGDRCWIKLRGHCDFVRALVVMPDGTLASGSDDKTVRLWNVSRGKCLRTLSGHTDWVYSLTALFDGKLASSSRDWTVRVWHAASGACLHTLVGHTVSVRSVATLPDGKLASGSDDGTVHVWDPNSGERLLTIAAGIWINGLLMLSNGALAIWSQKSVRVYE